MGDGGGYNEEPVESINRNQNDSNAVSPKVVKPDELYSKPDKVKKENTSTKVVRPEELYTQPEKVKKKTKSRKTANCKSMELPHVVICMPSWT